MMGPLREIRSRSVAVAVIQRFGGALNLNVHVHAIVLDGVFARHAAGALTFHSTRRLTALDVEEVLATVEPRIARLRRLRHASASIEVPAPEGCHARANGFDLHAGLVVPAGQRERLERVCRYALRPPGDRGANPPDCRGAGAGAAPAAVARWHDGRRVRPR